ncbi:BRCT domain-containing protein [Agrilactobacillus yilanensis]|uniref:BRCT domain-containing protein n=1 Tax=Agrilactobacillus yilanensis TaxID=2485997 RepID=A0ABW4J6C9_9LACO|nr:BRCT domain-containing protein [Agrilactobacillus yilanensis]
MQLNNLNVAVTGKLETMTLQHCLTLLKIIHANPQSNVSQTTDCLIVGTIRKTMFEAPETERLKLARAYNVPIITEKEFLTLVIKALNHLKNNLQ